MNNRPIGLFDSGFGGLTVMQQAARLMPQENLIYLGDTARLPYGNKSPETILRFALENAEFLLKKEIKLLMIACHTACCYALHHLQEQLCIPVIGVIEPGVQLAKKIQRLALLATSSTIESGLYQSMLLQQNPNIQLYPTPCPLFVPLVEEGFHNHPSAELIAAAYLNPLVGKIDAALLACTHYPLLRPLIQKTLGSKVLLLEPAEAAAKQALDYLKKNNLLNGGSQREPLYEFFATDAPNKFQKLGEIFFGSPIKKVEKKQEFMKSL